ncbi:riboflavin synthase alpha chain [Ferrithrix thermotolerans DSM 19514]|uniref:Riboflavin synthase n=1 Tax=Ferrithrix thermotolerans DSM 19514 TaxID=1121881 RepID=A0A1M4S6E3_9ACTN|nr:riboflavin synthase [Ferrithrix thermotolerans]SHE27768.1 riboflavin synthase alpha chain [Ferrithrix thermotolerans DSM 19514]
MFTGIVEHLGEVVSVEEGRLGFRWPKVASEVLIGDSIAVNGVCLTVVFLEGDSLYMDVVEETYRRSNLGDLRVGDVVNLERPRAIGERLDGHIVQGHVDTVGRVLAKSPDLWVGFEPEMGRYLVEKGSVAIDGISLTVVQALDDRFQVAVIPHTMGVTTLGVREIGDRVNLEFDVIAKYVEKLINFKAS